MSKPTPILTGKTRVRAGFFGGLVMQVQVLTRSLVAVGTMSALEWRDARAEDLFELQHLTYGKVEVDVKLPDVPMPEPEFAFTPPKSKKAN